MSAPGLNHSSSAGEVKQEGLVNTLTNAISSASVRIDLLRNRLECVSESHNVKNASPVPQPVECELAAQIRRLRGLDDELADLLQNLKL